MRASQLPPALLALAGVACPWLLVFGVAIHVNTHEREHGDARAAHHRSWTVALVLHGHRHEPGTPRHEHSIVVVKSARLSGAAPVQAAPSSPIPSDPGQDGSTPGRPGLSPGVGAGPPAPTQTLSVLRI